MTALVSRQRRGAFDCVVLDSPHNRNAMSIQLLDELLAAVADSAESPGRGLLLSHTGPAFCSGVDLRERRSLGTDDDSHSRLLGELLARLWQFPKPVVTSVDGAVRGGGMGLLACSDVVIATTSSSFAYAEVRVGVAPALVMAVTLPIVPLRTLLPWLLTGAVFDASTALRLGLVTTLAEAPRTAEAATLAALVKGAPGAQAAVKRIARAAVGVDVAAELARMTAESAALFTTPEAVEGMAAFAQRRPPAWAVIPEENTSARQAAQ
jgi:enoyl-CoA hydratase/carnithine racemase